MAVCEVHSVYTHNSLQNYTFYERYAASINGICQLCLIYSNIIRNYLYNDLVRREVAVFLITLVRRYKWYEKYAAGMQGKFDIFSIFMCNSLYNHTGMQSMRFTPPGPSGPINGMKNMRAV